MNRASAAPASQSFEWMRSALPTALPAWIVARVLVAGALVTSHLLLGHVDDPLARVTTGQGLLAWDGAFYADLAQHGYAALPHSALRFFPLTPLLGRAVGWLGFGPRVGVVIVANAAALTASLLLIRLVRREGFSDDVARRASWLLSLAPAAFVLVLSYGEGVFLALAIGVALAARNRSWVVAMTLGLLAGLSRPSGFIVAVPIAIEAARALRGISPRELATRVFAVLAPFAGTGVFLWWVGDQFGDALLPFRVQTRSNLKGSFTDPVKSISDAVSGLIHGRTVGTGLHVGWMIVVAVLLVICFRRLPASYGWFSLALVASAMTSANLDSFERYALGAFPLTIAVALIAHTLWTARLVIAGSAVAMTGYATLAFLHAYVP